MRLYELMYIISPNNDEDGVAALVERVNELIESLNGEVQNVVYKDPWGRRRLAYPIENFEEGYYVLSHFSIDPDGLDELERVLKLNEGIIRYLLIRKDD